MLLRDEFVSTSLCIHNCFLEGWRFELMLSWSRAGIDRNLCLEKTHILVKSYYVCWKQKLNANNVNNHNMWSQKIMVNRQKDVSPHLKGQEEKSLKTQPPTHRFSFGVLGFCRPNFFSQKFSTGRHMAFNMLGAKHWRRHCCCGAGGFSSDESTATGKWWKSIREHKWFWCCCGCFGVVVVVFLGGNCPCKKRRV